MAKFNNLSQNFTITPNSIINEKGIQLAVTGLYVYLASKPSNWEFSAYRISLGVKESESTIKQLLVKLEALGYLERKKIKNNNGQFVGIEYTLHDSPTISAVGQNTPHGKNTMGLNTDVGFTDGGKLTDINNTEYSNTDINNTDNINNRQNSNFQINSTPSALLNTEQDEIAPGSGAKKTKFGKSEFREELVLLGADEEVVNDWFSARDKKKLAYTKTALNGFLNECKKYNVPIHIAVEISATNGWGGFKYEWTDEFKRLNQNPKPYPNEANQAKPSGPKIGRVSVSKLEEVYRANTTNTSS